MLAAAVGEVEGESSPAVTLEAGELAALRKRVAHGSGATERARYLVDLGRATRAHPKVTLGLSPRGLLIWQRVSQAWAFLKGRPFVTPDDVKKLQRPVLGYDLGFRGTNVLGGLLEAVTVPA